MPAICSFGRQDLQSLYVTLACSKDDDTPTIASQSTLSRLLTLRETLCLQGSSPCAYEPLQHPSPVEARAGSVLIPQCLSKCRTGRATTQTNGRSQDTTEKILSPLIAHKKPTSEGE